MTTERPIRESKRTPVSLLAFLALLIGLVRAEPLPMTPVMTINGKVTLAQVGEKGRVYVAYDVRSVNGQGLRLMLFKPGQKVETDQPARVWNFTKPAGQERISFNDLPIAVYRVVGVALGAQGQPVAAPSFVVHVEYGGRRAWATYERPLNPDLRTQAPPFEGMGRERRTEGPSLVLSPSTLVLNAANTATIEAQTSLPADTELEWTLEGEGSLDKVGPRKVVYHAPDDPGEKRVATVRVTVAGKPELQANTIVLISNVKKEEIQH